VFVALMASSPGRARLPHTMRKLLRPRGDGSANPKRYVKPPKPASATPVISHFTMSGFYPIRRFEPATVRGRFGAGRAAPTAKVE